MNLIDSNTPNDGSYLWNVPPGLISSTVRLKIEVYNSSGTMIASDGSWGNFTFVTGSGMAMLESDLVIYTSTDPTYYQLLQLLSFIFDFLKSWLGGLMLMGLKGIGLLLNILTAARTQVH